MAPHAQAARGAALYAPCEDELNTWPRGRPADGSDDDYGLKADGALSQKAAELLDACDAEPDGDRRLALARRAYAAAPTAKNARRAYALALATSKRWGLLADLLEKWDISTTFGDGDVASRAAACGLRFASRYGAAELAAPADVALGAAQAAAKRAGDAFFAVGHFAEAAEAYGRGVGVAAHPTLSCDRAAALVAAGDFQGALASFDAAVDANPSCWRCRWARARCAGAVAAQGLALDDNDDDERRVETARARAEAAGKVALEDLARLRGVDFFAAVAALRAAATASVAALQKRRRSAQTRARARRREARTTYARTAPARTVRSHYDVLGISRDAGAAAVRRAYRKKALATHPDKTNGESEAFLAVGEAFRVLSDRGLREAYDAELDLLLS